MGTNPTKRPRRHTPPPGAPLFWCDDCEGSFTPNEDVDVQRHELTHERVLAATAECGPLMSRADRQRAEDDAARVFRRTTAERVAAAVTMLRGHYHRHMRMSAKAALKERYCTEQEFIAAASLERIFPADVAAELRKEYGHLLRPEIAMTDWNYPP